MPYTIVIDRAAGLLAACVPDGNGEAQTKEVEDYLDQSSEDHDPLFETIAGLMLTDDEPEDESRIVWRGHDCGWLTDTTGAAYKYAVRPA
jgi:hypothetical protein